MNRLGILAFGGALPQAIAALNPQALYVVFEGETAATSGQMEVAVASYERWGDMFALLRQHGVDTVVLAGHLTRPRLNPARFDQRTKDLAPRLLRGLQRGDDALLRVVIGIFEEEGFAVRGAHELVPDLTADAGLLCGPGPAPADLSDIDRARGILDALGPHDVGQAAVVVRGVCLGIETVQGTDAMLAFVAGADARLKGGGVLVKAPKPGQDLRADMPAIGPETVAGAVAAELSGIAVAASAVMILDRQETLRAAEAAGLFIVAQDF